MEEQARVWLDREGIAWTAREVAEPSGSVAGAPGGQGAAYRAPSAGGSVRPAGAKCELCSGEDQTSLWVEVKLEGEGISRVAVDATLRLCPDHRARLLLALGRGDSDCIEPS